MEKMKTLTLQGVTFEVVDEAARESIAALSNNPNSGNVVQSDWNQNDETAPDYVKNRTHWEENGIVHKIDEKYLPDSITRELEDGLTAVGENLTSLNTTLTNKISNNTTMINTNAKDIEALETQVNENNADIEALETQVNENNADIEALETQVNENKADMMVFIPKSTTLPSKEYWSSVAYGNGVFVAVCGRESSPRDIMAYSKNGINWNSISVEKREWRSVIYADGKFVAVTDKLHYYSVDGITWNRGTGPSCTGHKSIA
jgi:seryl-tRNA synthetase